jgi:hypothetical protein
MLDQWDVYEGGLYPTIARINHSCSPNATLELHPALYQVSCEKGVSVLVPVLYLSWSIGEYEHVAYRNPDSYECWNLFKDVSQVRVLEVKNN